MDDTDAINDPTNTLNQSLLDALSGMEVLLYDPMIIVFFSKQFDKNSRIFL